MSNKPFNVIRTRGMPVSNEALLQDLRRVAAELRRSTVPQPLYRIEGTYDDSTVLRRFGSWNDALKAAGLDISNSVNISDEDLYANLLELWTHYGRQPRRSELALPPSTVSQSPYRRRFRTWTEALERFAAYMEGTDAPDGAVGGLSTSRVGGRDPSLRLRFAVLKRDRFTCRSCGASPARSPEVELHVDHVVPWSSGGPIVIENLQTLCLQCNIGKSNVH